jgi:hypothetical protein
VAATAAGAIAEGLGRDRVRAAESLATRRRRSMVIANDAQIDQMDMDEVKAALDELPDLRARVLASGDVQALKSLKHRKVNLEARITEFKVSNLARRVQDLETEYQEVCAKANEQQRAGVVDAEAALAEREDYAERARLAHERYTRAVATQDYARVAPESVQGRLSEARAELERAMHALMDD